MGDVRRLARAIMLAVMLATLSVGILVRRLARAIMLGSAPTVRGQNVRGIEASRIRLGVIQPGENIADFNDALSTLTSSLAYLYTSGDRYWYDTRPTLRKTVEDRATQIAASDVEYEIETRLHALRKESPFSGLHVCPNTSMDVPDEQAARLIILRPNDEYSASNPDNNAKVVINEILNNRGGAQRIYRNMLVFIAPDQDLMNPLKQTVRRYLAWKSIKEDSEALNLDAMQNRETDDNLNRSNRTVDDQIKEAYCWLLVPYIDRVDIKIIILDPVRISGGTDGIITKAAKKMIQNESIITNWAPLLLLMQLNDLLWKDSDHIEVKKLWEYLCTYCYLPRLSAESVLHDAIQNGVNSTEYFAFASGYDGTRYIDLKYNQYIGIVERSGLLVKADVAQKQITAEQQAAAAIASGSGLAQADIAASDGELERYDYANVNGISGHQSGEVHKSGTPASIPELPKNTRFYMSAPLDNTRINRDVQKLVEEVISHLTSTDGVAVEVSLEVNVKAPNGLSASTMRTVSENCRTLRVPTFGFEE